VLSLVWLTASSFARAQTYKQIGEYKLTGATARGLAVDSDGRRLFVAAGDGVTVLNLDSGTPVGTIGGLKDAQDVLLVPEMKGDEKAPSTKGFATDASGHVVMFLLADMKPSETIKVETPGAVSLCYDNFSQTIEAVSKGGSLTTIDPETGKVKKAGRVPTGAGEIACGSLAHVFVADTAANVVHVLNHDTMKNEGDYPIMTGHGPSGMTLDTKGRRLFVTCEDGTIEIIDTDAGFTFIELKSGIGPAHATFAWTPQGKGQWKAAAFVAQSDGTLSGIKMNAYINYTLGGVYKLKPGLGAIAYDEKTHHLFIASTDSPAVMVVGY
jgi:DNA-binding beta-propeller fold protein YncE